MSTNPEQDALRERWALEARIPLSGVADGAVWRRARSVATGEDVVLFIVRGEAALEAADAVRRAYLVEDAHLLPVREIVVLDDPREGSDAATSSAGEGPTTVVEYPMPPSAPLAALLTGGPLHPETARAIIGEAATGLEVARRRGVRHQFLDSNRLFVDTRSGAVTILGVGVEAASHPGLDRSREVASFQDTAALVALLYRALTGRAPQHGADGTVPRPSTLVDTEIPADLDLLCDLVLNESAEDIPETTRGLIEALEPWQSIPVTFEAYPRGGSAESAAAGAAGAAGTAAAMGAAATGAQPTAGQHSVESDASGHEVDEPTQVLPVAERPDAEGTPAADAPAAPVPSVEGTAPEGAERTAARGADDAAADDPDDAVAEGPDDTASERAEDGASEGAEHTAAPESPAHGDAALAAGAAGIAGTAGAAGVLAAQSSPDPASVDAETPEASTGQAQSASDTPDASDVGSSSDPAGSVDPAGPVGAVDPTGPTGTADPADPSEGADAPAEVTDAPREDHSVAASTLVKDLHLDEKRGSSAFPGHLDVARAPQEEARPAGPTEPQEDTAAAGTDGSAAGAAAVGAAGAAAGAGVAAAPGDVPAAPPQEDSALPARTAGTHWPLSPAHSPEGSDGRAEHPGEGSGTATADHAAPTPSAAPSAAPDVEDRPTEAMPAAAGAAPEPGGTGPIVVHGRRTSMLDEPAEGAPAGHSRSSLLRDVVGVAVDADDPDTFALGPRDREKRSLQSQWIIVGGVIIVMIALIFAVTAITRDLRDIVADPLATSQPAPAPSTEEETGENPAEPTPTDTEEPELPAPELSGAEVFTQGSDLPPDNADQQDRMRDGDPGTYWSTKHYASPDFGGLKEGAGVRLTFAEESTLKKVTVTTARNSGGTIELRALNDDGSVGDVLASGELVADGEVLLEPSEPVETESVALWVPELPPDSNEQGRFRARIAEIEVE